jgi:hypothetical protein
MIFHVPGIDKVIRRSYSFQSSVLIGNISRFVYVLFRWLLLEFIHRLRPGDCMQVEGPYGDSLDADHSETC